MDYGQLTLEELKNGYRFDAEKDAYLCNTCERSYEGGQVFPVGEQFYDAAHAAAAHVETAHGGSLAVLMAADKKYNPLTDNQAELLRLFAQNVPDADIAKRLGVTASTVRHQKFTFREKAKQAKLYLALYELALTGKAAADSAIVPVHNTATCVDDRYVTTEKEKAQIMKSVFESQSPLRLRAFPPKAKKQIVILSRVVQEFAAGRQYTEKEVNQILKPIYEDYAILRRSLIDYGYMGRTNDGTLYWLL